jgi:hypothetical protein
MQRKLKHFAWLFRLCMKLCLCQPSSTTAHVSVHWQLFRPAQVPNIFTHINTASRSACVILNIYVIYSTAQCAYLSLLSAWCIYRCHSCIVWLNLAWAPLHCALPDTLWWWSPRWWWLHQFFLSPVSSSSSSLNCNRISAVFQLHHEWYNDQYLGHDASVCLCPQTATFSWTPVPLVNRLWLFVLLAVSWHQRLWNYVKQEWSCNVETVRRSRKIFKPHVKWHIILCW